MDKLSKAREQIDAIDKQMAYVVQITMPFVRIVVDDANHPVIDLRGHGHLPQDHLGRVARANHHDSLSVRTGGLVS